MAIIGVRGYLVEVEAQLSPALPAVIMVGLPDAAVSEARDRVRAAVINMGWSWPQKRITLGLSPAAIPKRGSGFDLALAAALLAADGAVPKDALGDLVLIGELGLDGRVREVRGVLPAVLAAVNAGRRRVVVPAGNRSEAALVPEAEVVAVAHLSDLVGWLRGDIDDGELWQAASDAEAEQGRQAASSGEVLHGSAAELASGDLADVRGQAEARYAVEVAAAGGHHLLLHGAPGTGKSMLALRLPGLLPKLAIADALEVTAIHSIAGALPPDKPLIDRPPFQDPHHTATAPAILGGGTGAGRPGAVSLAHKGVLLLDEAPEFGSPVMEGLREPMERGSIVVARVHATIRFPARFQLVLTANPCPCGLASGNAEDCRCSPLARRRYANRISGPVLDRIDIRQTVVAPTRGALAADEPEASDAVRARVREARERQGGRLAGTDWSCNGDIPGPDLRRRFPPLPEAMRLAEEQLRIGRLSPRGADRVLRVAWTVADLRGVDRPGPAELHTALGLRGSGLVAA